MKTYNPTQISTRLAALAVSALVVAAFAGTLERDSGRVERFAQIAGNSNQQVAAASVQKAATLQRVAGAHAASVSRA